MAQHQQHLLPLHEILRRNSSAQMMFSFVQGVLSCNPETPIPEAIKRFEDRFQIEDFNRKSALIVYYDMFHEYMNQNDIFNDKQNKRTTPRREKCAVFPKGMGTAGAGS